MHLAHSLISIVTANFNATELQFIHLQHFTNNYCCQLFVIKSHTVSVLLKTNVYNAKIHRSLYISVYSKYNIKENQYGYTLTMDIHKFIVNGGNVCTN